MQLFSLGASTDTLFPVLAQIQSPPPSANALIQQFRAELPAAAVLIVLWMVTTQVVSILAHWASSKVVAGEKATFGNAVKVWGLSTLSVILLGIVAAIAAGVLASMHQQSALIFVAAILLVLLLVILVAIPLKTYQIGCLGTLGFFLLSGLIAGAANFALQLVLAGPMQSQLHSLAEFKKLSKEDQQRLVTELVSHGQAPPAADQKAVERLPGETAAGDKTSTLAVRKAALELMYHELDRRRLAVNMKDDVAMAKYNDEKARYQNLLSQLRADAAAAAPAPPPKH